VSDAFRLPLDDVSNLHSELRSVSEELLHLLWHDIPEDDGDVGDASVTQILDAIQDVRLVRDRDELLRSRVSQRPKACAVSSR